MILCISAVSIVTSFSFLILLIWALSLFLLVSLAKVLSILFIFSKNQLLVSLIFSIFFSLYLIYFCCDLYDFFPSTNFQGFCSFSLVPLGVSLDCLFEIFLVS